MAVFKKVNQAIKKAYPDLDIEVVRGVGYFYFGGEDGFDVVESVMAHPTETSTEDVISMSIDAIEIAKEMEL